MSVICRYPCARPTSTGFFAAVPTVSSSTRLRLAPSGQTFSALPAEWGWRLGVKAERSTVSRRKVSALDQGEEPAASGDDPGQGSLRCQPEAAGSAVEVHGNRGRPGMKHLVEKPIGPGWHTLDAVNICLHRAISCSKTRFQALEPRHVDDSVTSLTICCADL
jgi:hypothetical protein